ncbi:MAG: GDSL-type esterase/lipase family protein [bacterium]
MDNLPELMKEWRAQCGKRSYRWLALGSSNTEVGAHSEGRHGWPCWLSIMIRAAVGQHVQMMNAGISGNTTANLLGRLEGDVLEVHPHLVVVTVGGNEFLQHRTLAEFESNLLQLELRLRQAGIPVAFQTYYSPLLEAGEGLADYMNVVRAVAKSTGSALIDQFSWFLPWCQQEPATYRTIMRDPMHLRPVGNALFGTLAGRVCGLRDPDFPPDMGPAICERLADMQRFTAIPPKQN